MSLDKQLVGVAAVAQNGVIGVEEANEMPWRLGEYASHSFWNNFKDKDSFRPQDMKHFRKLTQTSPVIMGRKTWESIPEAYRPLEGRLNMILSRSLHGSGEGFVFYDSKESVLQALPALPQEAAFVMGGQAVYEAFMPDMTQLVITRLHKNFSGDVYFPRISSDEWALVDEQPLGPIDSSLVSVETYIKKYSYNDSFYS